MTVLVVGSGGREHAVARKLRLNPSVGMIYALPGNAGMALDPACAPVERVGIPATDLDSIVEFARTRLVDFAVVTPDDPLCLGLVDTLESAGVAAFGPTKAAARIEGSKSFAKELMRRAGIPTAGYRVFDEVEDALAFVRQSPMPVWIKADGLALGKGVVGARTVGEAEEAARAAMLDGKFGSAGLRVVIEEDLRGVEASLLLFTDGERYRIMPAAMDHKRAFDGDRGPNTGGMGAIAPHPLVTPDLLSRIEREIIIPTLAAMREEGCPFKGCLFIGLMLTGDGPKVIEYNCRFGDPEAQAALALLESDLLDIMLSVRNGTLDSADVRFSGGAACCVVAASGGYPGAYRKGLPIQPKDIFLLTTQRRDVTIDYAGVSRPADGSAGLVTSGGRVLGVTAAAPTLAEASRRAYGALGEISFEGMRFRADIGAKALQLAGEEVMDG
ncbi:MAG: phosphoribosylamine--glycine ligase [Oscillospiraceae bacterium]|nr:phosphoribosylamine--glycine ligase [Oscillospiraceae bacterium]